MHCVEDGRYEALAVAPLASGRLDPPDIALFYATPGAMMYFINGLQWSGYKNFDWGVVGESACADSWGRALTTRQPSLSIPCFAERRYGGVLDDEMLMASPPEYLAKAISGMEALGKKRLSISLSAIRHPTGRARGHGQKLSGTGRAKDELRSRTAESASGAAADLMRLLPVAKCHLRTHAPQRTTFSNYDAFHHLIGWRGSAKLWRIACPQRRSRVLP